MYRKLWMNLIIGIAALLAVAGPVAAQSQTQAGEVVAAMPRAAAPSAQPADKLSYRLQVLAESAQLRAASAKAQAEALSLPESGPGSLLVDQSGRVLVDIRVGQVMAADLQALTDAGAVITHVAAAYRTVTAYLATSDLAKLAAQPTVENIQEEQAPQIDGVALGVSAAAPKTTAASCPAGSAVSEGDTQLRANLARSTYNVNGSGVKVGVLSDSYDQDLSAATNSGQDIATGDLPGPGNPCGFLTPVNVISDTFTIGHDEGRAMLQIIHDLAPGASLAFATAEAGIFTFADNIRRLRTWGADVIVDDITVLQEPWFQEGPIAVAVSDVVGSGAVYPTATGNFNYTISGAEVSSFETPAYRPVPAPNYLPDSPESCHQFDTTHKWTGVYLQGGGTNTFVLQWAQPWYGVTTDLNMYVVDQSANLIAKSTNNNTGPTGTQRPYESVHWSNSSGSGAWFYVFVCRSTTHGGDTGTPRFKLVMIHPTGLGEVLYHASGGDIIGPSVMKQAASPSSLAVAATQYNDGNRPEWFSSFGPATHYFGPVVGTAPAAAITPLLMQKPDFAATDGGCTTFFGSFSNGCDRFYGTSAAAPHAAGVAALLKQKANQIGLPFNGGLTKSLLQSTARPMSGGVPQSVGAGLIDALAAMQHEIALVRLFLPLLFR